MTYEAKVLALELAQELDGELGGGVAAALRDDGKTRAFGLTEAVAAAGLLFNGVQLAMQWASDKKMAELQAMLEEKLGKPDKVSPEKRASIIRRIVERFRGPAAK
jgi:hypothetical protein